MHFCEKFPLCTPFLTTFPLLLLIKWDSGGRCELVFENCFVPEENVLGKEGKGIATVVFIIF